MIDKRKIIADISALTTDLLKQVSRFSDHNFNTRPSAEEWSGGDVSAHLLMLATNVNRNLRARSGPADRPADEKIEIVSTVYDDYERKYNAVEQIIPVPGHKDRTGMLDQLDVQHKRLIEVVEQYDLTQICKGFNHPSLGAFTRLEWIYFIIHHAYRHINQMENILRVVA